MADFWALQTPMQSVFNYFICRKKETRVRFWLRKVFLKKAGAALVPSTLQRCRSNRDFRAVRAEISVLSRIKSRHSLEISAGSGCSVPREKQPASSVFEASSLFWVLALAPACWLPAFFCEMRCLRGAAQSPF